MSRTIVSIFPLTLKDEPEVSFTFRLEFPPDVTPNSRVAQMLHCRHDDPNFVNLDNGVLEPGTVKDVGSLLFNTLAEHDGVRTGITLALSSRDKTAPIYIYPDPSHWQVQKIPWETLYNPDNNFPEPRFLALNHCWPIARIVGKASTEPEILRTFKPPLRAMIILTAAGVSAAPEWNAIYNALSRTRPHAKLKIIVCERALKKAIDDLGNPDIKAEYLQSASLLLKAIDDFSPHILHFFCHGSTEGGPHLQLATLDDVEAGRANGTVTLEPSQLIHDTHLSKCLWLATLNCCKGAAAGGGEVDSIASGLVNAGFPAVVGMREGIDTSDAHLFCETFYPEVRKQIEKCVKASGQQVEIEWARALRVPRARLCEKHSMDGQTLAVAATRSKEWTLPVMYVRPEPFKLHVRPAKPTLSAEEQRRLQAKIDRLREARDFLANNPDMPPGAITELDGKISEVENELYR